ncbi:hypothetical protein B194_3426 [Serratia plymuthica A30]|nr:hypothetical protein B194_3426 [Serratia plymuthica A30]
MPQQCGIFIAGQSYCLINELIIINVYRSVSFYRKCDLNHTKKQRKKNKIIY